MKNRAMSTLMENLIYLIILAVFVSSISVFLWSKSNSAFLWEDFYAKELSRIVSAGEKGDSYRLDVQHATTIAKRNGLDIREASNLFIFNAQTKEACVKLSMGEGKCNPYFNDNLVTDINLELGMPTNFLSFKISGVESE